MRTFSLGTILVLCYLAYGCGDGELPGQVVYAATTIAPATEPLSTLPSRSRYFVTSHGDPVYLTGSHTHLNLVDRPGEDPALAFETYLEFLKHHNHNFTKLWAQEDTRHVPLPYVRVGPSKASDGKPKFDLTRLNQVYFDRLRARVTAAGREGIYVAVMLFNGWSVEGKVSRRDVWSKHPFHSANNVNGIDGDPNGDREGVEVQTLKIPAVTAIQEAYVRKVIDSINDLDNVLYEISNESTGTVENTAWQHHFIEFIRNTERKKSKQHPVGMTTQWPGMSNQVLHDSAADWISPNQNEGYQTSPPANEHGKIVLNDTDHLWGNGGNAAWVWKTFTRGLNPIFMDVTTPLSNRYTLPQAEEIRAAMGDTLEYAHRIDLKNMAPRQDLCSTSFCLVKPGHEYLIYFHPTGSCSNTCQLTVDLSDVDKPLTVEWFSPDTRNRKTDSVLLGGTVRTFVPPFPGPSVLYLKVQS